MRLRAKVSKDGGLLVHRPCDLRHSIEKIWAWGPGSCVATPARAGRRRRSLSGSQAVGLTDGRVDPSEFGPKTFLFTGLEPLAYSKVK